jgi:SAM-dependent methyltransferase/uncharacterized protein YbaR (Trm112 family)
MQPKLVSVLACPGCGGGLALEAFRDQGGLVEEGVLRCECRAWFPVLDGIPRLLLPPYRPDYSAFLERHGLGLGPMPGATTEGPGQRQVQESYSAKWGRMPRWGFDRPAVKEFFNQWFARKLGLSGVSDLDAYFAPKRALLDAGTGLGAKVETMASRTRGEVLGVDISDGVVHARANTGHLPNAHIVQADLHALPFRPGTFDFIVSDGVLHHTPDTRAAFRALLPCLAPGGEIAIHVYRKLGPIREFCDDYIRARTTRLSAAECWDVATAFTDLGRALADLKVEIEVPTSIPVLEIPAGRYDLQRFLYYHVFKCFWNPDFPYDENTLVNFDWYHPANAHRHTEAEVVGWFVEAGLEEIVALRPNEGGVAVRARKPARTA